LFSKPSSGSTAGITEPSSAGSTCDAVVVDDRGERHVVRIEARFEDRPQARVDAQREAAAVGRHHVAGTLIDRLLEHHGARAALFQADAGQPREKVQAQQHDDRADDRSDAEDLLAFDA
jgi:hypothetical protein